MLAAARLGGRPGSAARSTCLGDTGGGAAGGRSGAQGGTRFSVCQPLDPVGVTFEEEGLAADLGHRVEVGAASVGHVLPGPGGTERGQGREAAPL